MNAPETIGQGTVPDPEIDDVDQSAVAALWGTHRNMYVGSLVLAVLAAVVIAGLLIAFDPSSTSVDQNDDSLAFAFIPLLAPLAMNLNYRQKMQHEMFEQIAAALGYTYSPGAPVDNLPGLTFSRGHAKRIFDVLSGSYRDLPMRMFGYTYVVGYGKGTQVYQETIIELTYPYALPHIVLGPPARFALAEMHFPSDLEPVTLEGDFGRHFSLFISKGLQLQAREIFEPDLMQRLIDQYAQYHIEIVGSKLYLVRAGTFTKRADVFAMQNLADGLVEALIPGLRSVKEDAPAVA